MSKRRPSGDGMIRKREDGRWEGRIVVGHKQNGEPIFFRTVLPNYRRRAENEYNTCYTVRWGTSSS